MKKIVYKEKKKMSIFYPYPWKANYFWNKLNSFVDPQGCTEFINCKQVCDVTKNDTDGQCIAFNFYSNNCPGDTEGSCYLLSKFDLQSDQTDASTFGNITSYIINEQKTINLQNNNNTY